MGLREERVGFREIGWLKDRVLDIRVCRSRTVGAKVTLRRDSCHQSFHLVRQARQGDTEWLARQLAQTGQGRNSRWGRGRIRECWFFLLLLLLLGGISCQVLTYLVCLTSF